jgi:hypothetical protein
MCFCSDIFTPLKESEKESEREEIKRKNKSFDPATHRIKVLFQGQHSRNTGHPKKIAKWRRLFVA